MESRRAEISPSAEISTADLLRSLRDESAVLVKQEIALAKEELNEMAGDMARNGALMAAGAAVAVFGAMLLCASVAMGVAKLFIIAGIPAATAYFLGFLIGGLLIAGGGAIAAYVGWKRFSSLSFYPRETVAHFKKETQKLRDRL